MKKLLLLFAILSTTGTYAQDKSETFPLESMIAIINNSLDKANKRLDSIDLNVKSATITLKTSYDKSGGGGFKLFVKASKKWQLEKANTMKFVYEKVDSANQKSVEFFNNEKVFEENLTNAIVSAANQWQNTTQTIEGLSKNSFSVEISFMIKNITEGGIEFEIWGAGIDSGVDYEKAAVHLILLSFK